MSGTRRLDGTPETLADKRFFALRESGYRGPIDQDGNRVDDVAEWIDHQLHGRAVMTEVQSPLSTPGPVDDIRQDNAHRVGAPNHLEGSGENPMVDTHPRPNCPCGQPVDPIAGTVAERINQGDLSDPWTVPELVTSLVTEIVADRTAALRVELASVTAELDAANDAVTELIGQLDEARADTWRAETGGVRR